MTTPRTAVRRLALARMISVTGSAAAYTALLDAIFRLTDGSSTWLSATLLLTFGVNGLVGPFAGALGDRFDRRRLMIASDLAGAACFLVLALLRDPGAMLVVAFLSAVVETPFFSASMAAVPNLVEERDISWANSLIAVGRNVGIMVGPALGGVLAAAVGAHAVFAANAVSFVGSALLVVIVRGSFSGDPSGTPEYRGLRAGFVFIFRDRVLRTIAVAWVTLVAGASMVMVADRPLAEAFGTGAVGFGLIIALFGAGSVAGSLSGRFMDRRSEPRWLVIGTALVALAGLVTGLSPLWAPILVMSFTWGVGDGLTLVAEQSIRQRRTPDAVRSRVVAASDAMVHGTMAVGFAVAGPVLDAVGAQGAYLVGGVAAFLATLVLLPLLPLVGGARRWRVAGRVAADGEVAGRREPPPLPPIALP